MSGKPLATSGKRGGALAIKQQNSISNIKTVSQQVIDKYKNDPNYIVEKEGNIIKKIYKKPVKLITSQDKKGVRSTTTYSPHELLFNMQGKLIREDYKGEQLTFFKPKTGQEKKAVYTSKQIFYDPNKEYKTKMQDYGVYDRVSSSGNTQREIIKAEEMRMFNPEGQITRQEVDTYATKYLATEDGVRRAPVRVEEKKINYITGEESTRDYQNRNKKYQGYAYKGDAETASKQLKNNIIQQSSQQEIQKIQELTPFQKLKKETLGNYYIQDEKTGEVFKTDNYFNQDFQKKLYDLNQPINEEEIKTQSEKIQEKIWFKKPDVITTSTKTLITDKKTSPLDVLNSIENPIKTTPLDVLKSIEQPAIKPSQNFFEKRLLAISSNQVTGGKKLNLKGLIKESKVDTPTPTTTQTNIARRIAIYNLEANNIKNQGFLKSDPNKIKDLEIQREQLSAVLLNKISGVNPDEFLTSLKPNKLINQQGITNSKKISVDLSRIDNSNTPLDYILPQNIQKIIIKDKSEFPKIERYPPVDNNILLNLKQKEENLIEERDTLLNESEKINLEDEQAVNSFNKKQEEFNNKIKSYELEAEPIYSKVLDRNKKIDMSIANIENKRNEIDEKFQGIGIPIITKLQKKNAEDEYNKLVKQHNEKFYPINIKNLNINNGSTNIKDLMKTDATEIDNINKQLESGNLKITNDNILKIEDALQRSNIEQRRLLTVGQTYAPEGGKQQKKTYNVGEVIISYPSYFDAKRKSEELIYDKLRTKVQNFQDIQSLKRSRDMIVAMVTTGGIGEALDIATKIKYIRPVAKILTSRTMQYGLGGAYIGTTGFRTKSAIEEKNPFKVGDIAAEVTGVIGGISWLKGTGGKPLTKTFVKPIKTYYYKINPKPSKFSSEYSQQLKDIGINLKDSEIISLKTKVPDKDITFNINPKIADKIPGIQIEGISEIQTKFGVPKSSSPPLPEAFTIKTSTGDELLTTAKGFIKGQDKTILDFNKNRILEYNPFESSSQQKMGIQSQQERMSINFKNNDIQTKLAQPSKVSEFSEPPVKPTNLFIPKLNKKAQKIVQKLKFPEFVKEFLNPTEPNFKSSISKSKTTTSPPIYEPKVFLFPPQPESIFDIRMENLIKEKEEQKLKQLQKLRLSQQENQKEKFFQDRKINVMQNSIQSITPIQSIKPMIDEESSTITNLDLKLILPQEISPIDTEIPPSRIPPSRISSLGLPAWFTGKLPRSKRKVGNIKKVKSWTVTNAIRNLGTEFFEKQKTKNILNEKKQKMLFPQKKNNILKFI